MKCKKIIEELEKRYPPASAEEWDNPGLLVGNDEQEIHRVYLTLDVTGEAVKKAVEWKADLIISHHPMIFSSLRQINNHHFISKKILDLVENHISCYAMHTNFDVCKMAEINAGLLKIQNPEVLYVTAQEEQKKEGIGRVGKLPEEMSLKECAQYVKSCFGLSQVKVFGDLDSTVCRAAVSGGSGKSMVSEALKNKAQVLITGDIDHHTGIDAVDQGLAIIDAGHYGTEYFFMEQVKKDLQEIDSELLTVCAEVKLPYTYV